MTYDPISNWGKNGTLELEVKKGPKCWSIQRYPPQQVSTESHDDSWWRDQTCVDPFGPSFFVDEHFITKLSNVDRPFLSLLFDVGRCTCSNGLCFIGRNHSSSSSCDVKYACQEVISIINHHNHDRVPFSTIISHRQSSASINHRAGTKCAQPSSITMMHHPLPISAPSIHHAKLHHLTATIFINWVDRLVIDHHEPYHLTLNSSTHHH